MRRKYFVIEVEFEKASVEDIKDQIKKDIGSWRGYYSGGTHDEYITAKCLSIQYLDIN